MSVSEVHATRFDHAVFTHAYSAQAESACLVRRDVRDWMASINSAGNEELEGAARLVASELFGNAVRHHPTREGEEVLVRVLRWSDEYGEWLGVSMIDCGQGTLAHTLPARVAEEDEGGRGLEVIRGLGARLTGLRVPGGYQVTAWIPVLDEVRQRVCRCDCIGLCHDGWRVCEWVVPADHISGASTADHEWPSRPVCLPCREHAALFRAELLTPVSPSSAAAQR